ncbi:hypothetical protein COLO4_22925 [Corchorus olitorius]|uniref:Uncharacterized protein n=1 Tax=Corchorus olitorius TaxID=93759 RepID=A0A1R3IJ29_9ROSI|nr:hypothetical protein COLO4_22925 [Corchorus olitorius]
MVKEIVCVFLSMSGSNFVWDFGEWRRWESDDQWVVCMREDYPEVVERVRVVSVEREDSRMRVDYGEGLFVMDRIRGLRWQNELAW